MQDRPVHAGNWIRGGSPFFTERTLLDTHLLSATWIWNFLSHFSFFLVDFLSNTGMLSKVAGHIRRKDAKLYQNNVQRLKKRNVATADAVHSWCDNANHLNSANCSKTCVSFFRFPEDLQSTPSAAGVIWGDNVWKWFFGDKCLAKKHVAKHIPLNFCLGTCKSLTDLFFEGHLVTTDEWYDCRKQKKLSILHLEARTSAHEKSSTSSERPAEAVKL